MWENDGNKSPRPDGFNLNFYKSCWDLVESDILNFIHEFVQITTIPKAIGASFVTLIPNVTCPQELNEFRPITLIGSLYKILAKTLAGRFKKVLRKVISECQNAFLQRKTNIRWCGYCQ